MPCFSSSKDAALNKPRRPVLVVIPAYNEAATVADVVRRVIAHAACEVLVVNDASVDDTAAQARTAGATVIGNPARALVAR